ncbi:hypothetical protein [Deinococcus cavernae]|uniref:hypothetical protein n=1 Tax=Deinococcus cavernae TaxID=2320857 RepID=UPI0030833D0F
MKQLMKQRSGKPRAGRPARSTRRGRRALLAALLGLTMLGGAQARTVKIITAQTLELRNQDGQEIVIIAGENVEIRLDDDIIKAKRVEFNRTRRTLTLVGYATYHTAKDGQDLKGNDLVVDLGSEALTGQDVLISDADLEIRGAAVERVPGQLRAQGGYFTPCAKCGRTPNDYAFRAQQLVVYPGDRLIAYRAQLLIAERPVLYLPVVVLPLNDQARQPRLAVGRGDPDGLTVEADLPFSVGSSVLGTTLLRYYQYRSPSFGGGVDLHAYAPNRLIDRADLYFLALPKPFLVGGDGEPERQSGYDLDLNFSVKGRVPLMLAEKDMEYALNVVRRDIGLPPEDKSRGVTLVDFSAQADYPRFSARLNYNDRFGPPPEQALSRELRHPEVIVDVKPFTVSLGGLGDVSADFKFSAGQYTAASNPLSRSASLQGLNYTTSRLEEVHALSYTRPLWRGAEIAASNTFTGRYYGNGSRTVQLEFGVKFTQRWAGSNTFTVEQRYLRYEGTSPFAFDVVSRRLSAPLDIRVDTVPVRDTTFSVTYTRDGFRQPGQKERTQVFGVSGSVNRKPVSAYYNLSYDFATDNLSSGSFSVTVGDPDSGKLTLVPATPALLATPTAPAVPARAAYYRRSSAWPFPNLSFTVSGGYALQTRIQPVTVKATVTDGGARTNYFSVSGTYDLQGQAETLRLNGGTLQGEERNLTNLDVNYSASATFDAVLNPLSVSGSESLNLRDPYLSGNHNVNWRGFTFNTNHSLDLETDPATKESGTVNFSVGNPAGSATNWNLNYGGPYDLRRGGFTRPQLTAAFKTTVPGQRLAASASINLRGLDQPRTELSRASLDAAWQKGRFAVSGQATYSRVRSGEYPNDQASDTLVVDPLRVGVGLGKGPRPDVYLTASLRQTFRYVGGVRQDDKPISPVFGLTWDRCCWALQGEYDVGLKRLRIAIGLPGQTYSIFDRLDGSNSYPFKPYAPTY